jgi:excisionase family DNA binding protein
MNEPVTPLPVLYATYKEAAIACRLSESMVRKLAHTGKLKIKKFGRSARIPLSELTHIEESR